MRDYIDIMKDYIDIYIDIMKNYIDRYYEIIHILSGENFHSPSRLWQPNVSRGQ